MDAIPKIVVSLQTDQQRFQRLQAEEAHAAASKYGVDVEVIYADSNSVVQVQQLYARISAPREGRPAAILLESVGPDGLERMAESAVEAGIAWVLLSAHAPYVERLRSRFPRTPVFAIAVDNDEIGRIQGGQFRAILPRGGSILYVEGPSTAGSVRSRRAATERMLQGSGIRMEKRVFADWTEAGAERAVSSWLAQAAAKGDSIDLVGAQNDTMAMGARRAILAQRPEWIEVPFTGCDGLPDEGLSLVAEGVLTATVVKPPTAGKAVEMIARALRGEEAAASMTLEVRSVPPVEQLAHRYR